MYSLASECRVVRKTLADLEAISEGGYEVWLPKGISQYSSQTSVRKAVAEEFEASSAMSSCARLSKFTNASALPLNRFLERYPTAPSTVRVILTSYGVGGYYETPDLIVINQRSTWDGLESALVHELVHLCIEEPIVLRLKLDDSAKEGLVDHLILNDPILSQLIPNYHQQTKMTTPTPALLRQLSE
jgi:hypothetical protein